MASGAQTPRERSPEPPPIRARATPPRSGAHAGWRGAGAALRSVPTEELWAMRASRRPPAREELIRRFSPLARRLASRYQGTLEPDEDLHQVALVGLINAIDRFDPGRGHAFASFAIPTILGELRRHFRNTGWAVRVPRDVQERSLRVARATRDLRDRTGRPVSVRELARLLDISLDDLLEALQAAQAHYAMSLDGPVSDAAHLGPTLVDVLGAPDPAYSVAELMIDLVAGCRRLPAPERRALWLTLARDLKQSEIAAILGCSQMQVSRLLASAARALAPVAGTAAPPEPRRGC